MQFSPIPDQRGYYGRFGGAYIPEILHANVENLQKAFSESINDEAFNRQYRSLLRDYVGRPSPLTYSESLSRLTGAEVYLKREDLNHTGAHKINNAIGSALLAKRMGKTRIIAETGAGQHGVATATVCALMGMKCVVYMGATDMARQRPNVERMRMLGAEVVAVESGNKTLKDATNEAIRDWCTNPSDTFYIIGSTVGPHPYPQMVAYFQSVISEEIKFQLLDKVGRSEPDCVVACVGGGSNAAGAFYHFIDSPQVRLIVAEAAGKGVDTDKSAATMKLGREGIIHGSRTMLMQTVDGQIVEPYSISAGLDYPGIGPLHAHLASAGRSEVVAITDNEAIAAAHQLTRSEGIIPALESAHALAALRKVSFKPGSVVVVNLSGRGDKDMQTYMRYEQNL
ncbi:MAG: tryptophan synthase subunit beta [Muribaculum sp.]|nr:tryptophan synthase subunit beta [Muribaculaceae bacterium]MCM1081448.1 tryptophan synthase subunit beta [Muribaculum sp.]